MITKDPERDLRRIISPSPLPVCITMLVPSLLLLPQCSLTGASLWRAAQAGSLHSCADSSLVQENSDTQITISSQAMAWGRGKERSDLGTVHQTDSQTNLVCRDTISISWEGKDTR